MKTLVLLRHSEAEDGGLMSDYDRKLTSLGVQKIAVLAQNIQAQNFKPNYILASAAIRAYSTAKILAQHIDYQVDKIESRAELYNRDAQTLIDVILDLPNEMDKIVFVNHNPAISELASWLNDEKQYLSLSPCHAVCLQLDINEWNKILSYSGKILWKY
jgi:phosphohistidine phosphatase